MEETKEPIAEDVKLSWLTRLAVMLGLGSNSHAMTSAERQEKMEKDVEDYMRGKLPRWVRSGDVLPLVFYPSPVLKQSSQLVTDFDADFQQLVKSLGATMYLCGGVGLSAIQVGIPLRVFVADLRDIRKFGDRAALPAKTSTTATEEPAPEPEPEEADFRVYVNPTILSVSPEMENDIEGCLSMPNIREKLARPKGVTLTAYDERGRLREETLEGWPARIVQHEMEHLTGVTFVSHLGPMQRRMIDKRVDKLRRSVAIDTKNGQRRAARAASKGRGR